MNLRSCECGCGQSVKSYMRFAGKNHEINYFETHNDLLCECGCGNPVVWNGQRYPRYINGHQSKPYVDWSARANRIIENAPLCLCGCGEKVHVNKERVIYSRSGEKGFSYPKYLPGHGIRKIDQSITLKKEEEDLIIGTCLGDGSIQYPHRQSCFPRLVIRHGRVQHSYNCFKASVLARFDPSVCVVKNGGYGDFTSVLMTSCHKVFDSIYHIFYKKVKVRRKKRITKELYPYLNRNVLMWWFLDDGSNSLLRDSSQAHAIISTNGFPKENVILLSEMLQEKFHLKSTVSPPRDYWYLRFNNQNSSKLIKLIADLVPFCMRYKVGES